MLQPITCCVIVLKTGWRICSTGYLSDWLIGVVMSFWMIIINGISSTNFVIIGECKRPTTKSQFSNPSVILIGNSHHNSMLFSTFMFSYFFIFQWCFFYCHNVYIAVCFIEDSGMYLYVFLFLIHKCLQQVKQLFKLVTKLG